MKTKITFGKDFHGTRFVVWGDMLACLYERGLNDLAKELTERAEAAFDEIEKQPVMYGIRDDL